ncbi:hypothetical protein [Hazenella coriacea]|uniref:Uncharacterized protein n=1 Tax=Hazenella coriacea TaxID=1179467 RepID=A0A4R3L0B9_9BACL|nr:hypothetical protein [Hazenella coriacea]TCS92359.1 hypothetical protein EDD58_11320 [Hazenella coriacea]
MSEKQYEIRYDERLQVERPYLNIEYECLPEKVQQEFELKCQEICSQIPEQIKLFEQKYMVHFDQLRDVEDETEFLRLTEEMNEISSVICDLNILFLTIEGNFIHYSSHA